MTKGTDTYNTKKFNKYHVIHTVEIVITAVTCISGTFLILNFQLFLPLSTERERDHTI